MEDTCATGGSLDLALAEGRAFATRARAALTFTPPPGAAVRDVLLLRALETADGVGDVYAAAVRARHDDLAFADHGCGLTVDASCHVLGAMAPGAANPADPGDPANVGNVVTLGGPLAAVQLWVACETGTCPRPPRSPVAAHLRLFGARIELEDDAPPSAPELSGSLAAGAPVAGTAFLHVRSADDGGGIAAVRLSIDGVPAQVIRSSGTDGSCAEPYAVAQPCPTAVDRVFAVDAGALAPGPHVAAGAVVDAAGNATPFGPLPFTVAHRPDPPTAPAPPAPAPPAPRAALAPDNGRPAVRRPRIRLQRRRLDRPAGRAARIAGTVRTADGRPVAGARLDVEVRQLGTVALDDRTVGEVVTDRRGRFAVRLHRPTAPTA